MRKLALLLFLLLPLAVYGQGRTTTVMVNSNGVVVAPANFQAANGWFQTGASVVITNTANDGETLTLDGAGNVFFAQTSGINTARLNYWGLNEIDYGITNTLGGSSYTTTTNALQFLFGTQAAGGKFSINVVTNLAANSVVNFAKAQNLLSVARTGSYIQGPLVTDGSGITNIAYGALPSQVITNQNAGIFTNANDVYITGANGLNIPNGSIVVTNGSIFAGATIGTPGSVFANLGVFTNGIKALNGSGGSGTALSSDPTTGALKLLAGKASTLSPGVGQIETPPVPAGTTNRYDGDRANDSGISVLNTAGASTNSVDNGPAFSASLLTLNPLGDTWIVPRGNYNFTSSIVVPHWSSGTHFTFLLDGAVLSTTNPIVIMDRYPTNQTEASSILTAIIIHGGTFHGTGLTNQTGIRLGATYNSVVDSTSFQSLGVGLDGYFDLGMDVRNSLGTLNSVSDWRIQSGTNKTTLIGWAGATLGNSQCNNCVFWKDRSYASVSQPSQLAVYGCDGTSVIDCIFEGFNPVDAIWYDDQGSTTCRTFSMKNIHSENLPSDALVNLTLQSGIFNLDTIYRQLDNPLLNCSNSGAIIFNIENVAYVGNLTTAFKAGPNFTGWTWHFNNWNGASTLNTNWWAGGITQNNQSSIIVDSVNAFPYLNFRSMTWGDTSHTNLNALGFAGYANLTWGVDDEWYVGHINSGLPLQRPHDIWVGSGGVASWGDVISTNNVKGSNIVATATAYANFETVTNAPNLLLGFNITHGTNKRSGTAVLSGGTVVVANTTIASGDYALLSYVTTGTQIGILSAPLSLMTNGSAFVINSSYTNTLTETGDTNIVAWLLYNQN